MERLGRMERPYLYGFRGSSKWLLDVSMVIWNVVGIVALVGLVAWLRERFPSMLAIAGTGDRPAAHKGVSGRKSRLTMPFSQMEHARSVIGDETSEDILERELALTATPHREKADDTPTSEDILRAELANARGQGESGETGKTGP
jgi:hypothetical protein